jgi:hypothetical protein
VNRTQQERLAVQREGTDRHDELRTRVQRSFARLEHVPKKLLNFFDQGMLQLFDSERVLIDQMILFDRDAL